MTKLLLAGCGKMGSAMLSSWLDRGLPAKNVTVVEPNVDANSWLVGSGVSVVPSSADVGDGFEPDVVVLAVKPQMMDDIVPGYSAFVGSGCLYISIAAGRTVDYFEGRLGNAVPIIRCMPNTPASVRRGITVAYANQAVSDDQKRLCEDLLEAVGDMAWVDDESLMDAVTAVSGSGPAYVFLLVEAMARAGEEVGLPEGLAMRLARATVAGAGELLFRSEEAASQLRKNVTSPGGTTAAALNVLMGGDGWQPILSEAISAAARRSRELAG
ncbi:MAG: pyrroline-5-carboxylate reductase [Rhodospirillales bacterium]|nr:pyrroline-5-carboxylate reductase [Rhodospirillales bacterium]